MQLRGVFLTDPRKLHGDPTFHHFDAAISELLRLLLERMERK